MLQVFCNSCLSLTKGCFSIFFNNIPNEMGVSWGRLLKDHRDPQEWLIQTSLCFQSYTNEKCPFKKKLWTVSILALASWVLGTPESKASIINTAVGGCQLQGTKHFIPQFAPQPCDSHIEHMTIASKIRNKGGFFWELFWAFTHWQINLQFSFQFVISEAETAFRKQFVLQNFTVIWKKKNQ